MRWAPIACLLLACASTHEREDASADGARPDARSTPPDAGADAAIIGDCERPSDAEVARLRERVMRAWCERIDPCDDWRRWPDVESCMRYEAGAHFAARSWTSTGEREVLDIDAAEACLEGLACPYLVGWRFGWVTDGESFRCEPLRRLCAGEPAEPGAHCNTSRQCSEGFFCGATECERVCQPRAPTGSPCPDGNAAYVCARGPSGELALCMSDELGAPHRCRIGRVVAPVGEGEPCGPSGLPADILDLVPCAEGLLCIEVERGSVPPRVCMRPAALDEPCNAAGCAFGLTCDWDTSRCTEPEVIVPIAIGAACADLAEQHTCDGQWGTECIDEICVASRGEGQPCDTFWPDWDPFRVSYCDAPLVCSSGTCARPALPLGASCAWPAEDLCESRCCDHEERVCAPRSVCWGDDPCE